MSKYFLIAIILVLYGCDAYYKVPGSSMEPAIPKNSYIRVDKDAYKEADVKRFDIVAFNIPGREEEANIKRIIALGGETIEIKDDVVFINGKPLEEPFKVTKGDSHFRNLGEKSVPVGSYFVLGDNHSESYDSRFFGSLSKYHIIGKVKE